MKSKWYPSEQSSSSYSPLRNARDAGMVLIDGEYYDAPSEKRRTDNYNDKLYRAFTSQAEKVTDVDRQLLDLYVNRFAKKK